MFDPWPWIKNALRFLSSFHDNRTVLYYGFQTSVTSSTNFPVIIDTGASQAITPARTDFITYRPISNSVLKGLATGLQIEGEGEVQWTFNNIVFKLKCYHVPQAPARLLSPQAHLQSDTSTPINAYSTGPHGMDLLTSTGILSTIPFDASNLPVLHMCNVVRDPQVDPKAYTIAMPGYLSIIDEMNSNLSDAQKELLRFHYKLGHRNMKSIQDILKTKALGWNDVIRRATRCPTPVCSCCLYGKQHCRPVKRERQVVAPPPPSSIRKNNLIPGQQVSIDLFSVTEGGRPLDGRVESNTIKGGCIFVDHATSYVHVEPMTSFTASDILRAKVNYEILMRTYGLIVMDYHSDNGVFNSRLLQQHLQNGEQTLALSGVGAQFQDGIAERNIGTIISMARTMLLHAMTRWNLVTLALWPFAVEYACKIHNILPKSDGSPSAIELITRTKVTSNHYKDIHVFGAPTYVLAAALQNGHKLPKWEARSKQGIFLGHSRKHASSVAMVLNTSSNYVSPQYHVVIDDWFTTSTSNTVPPAIIQSWATMFPNGLLSTPTDDPDDFVADEWLLEDELNHRRNIRSSMVNPALIPSTSPTDSSTIIPTTSTQPTMHDQSLSNMPSARSESQREEQLLLPQSLPSQREPPPSVSPQSEPPRAPPPLSPHVSQPTSSAFTHPSTSYPELRSEPAQGTSPRRSGRMRRQAVRFSDDATYEKLYSNLAANVASFLNGTMIRNDVDLDTHDYLQAGLHDLLVHYGSHLDPTHPVYAYLAATPYGLPSLSESDTLRYHEMLASMDRELFEAAMDLEIGNLESYKTWKTTKRSRLPKGTKVYPTTWVFRRKRNPDGSLSKHKARFCVRGDLQKDVDETYSPVAQATTIRLMLILVLLRKLKCTQVDYVNAFAQSPLDEPIYIEIPKGFYSDEDDVVLKLERSLYGLVQAPRLFYEHLKKNLIARGFKPSEFDPCLFISKKVICLVYVDDCLFFSAKQEYIDEVIASLQKDMTLTIEGNDISKFLGIDYTKQKDGSYSLKQPGLTQKVIDAVGLTRCKPELTPASELPLALHPDSPAFSESWNYASIVGMLMYLANQTRPDIAFAVHQVARYTHNPREIHGKAVKRIVRYLAGTKNEGLIFTPNFDVGLEMYCDADFAGLWKTEDPANSASVKSRTGFVIKLYGCPLLWTSRLQTEIAASTLEAEYIALSSGMRELIPIRGLYQSMAQHMNFQDAGCLVRCTVFEDNQGALALATSPKLTPRTKHIGVKYHFFREHVLSGKITLEFIPSVRQQADILTKGLTTVKFSDLRKLLCGW